MCIIFAAVRKCRGNTTTGRLQEVTTDQQLQSGEHWNVC